VTINATAHTSYARAEASRRNGRKSKGPSAAGRQRSRFNAVKHGLRAKLPVLPGEDAGAYQARLDGWIESFQPRNAAELYLVERVAQVSWQMDRADRLEVACFAVAGEQKAAERARQAAEEGAALFRIRRMALRPGSDNRNPDAQPEAISWPTAPDHPDYPANRVAKLEATAAGCQWMIDQWAELRQVIEAGGSWQTTERVQAVRLLGKQPVEALCEEQGLMIYLACHAVEPAGPDPFADPLRGLTAAREERCRSELTRTRAADRQPPDPSAGRAALLAIIASAVARLEALRDRHQKPEPVNPALARTRLEGSLKQLIDQAQQSQATYSRTFLRTLDALYKLRRECNHEAAEECEDDAIQEVEVDGETSTISNGDGIREDESSQVGKGIHGDEPTLNDELKWEDEGPSNSSRRANVALVSARNPTNEPSTPAAVRVNGPEPTECAARSTNEPNGPDRSPPSASGPPPTAPENTTNEPNGRSESAKCSTIALPAVVGALLVFLFGAAVGAAVAASARPLGPDHLPGRYRDAEKTPKWQANNSDLEAIREPGIAAVGWMQPTDENPDNSVGCAELTLGFTHLAGVFPDSLFEHRTPGWPARAVRRSSIQGGGPTRS
jgi:hypothetical protein